MAENEQIYLVRNQAKTVLKAFASIDLAEKYVQENKLVGESWVIMELIREE